jgi:thioredoxin 1
MSVENMTLENYQSIIAENNMVIIDFWAEWCGPCKMFSPIFDKLAAENPEVKFCKVNTEEQQELSGMFGIRSIPTLAFFREEVLLHQQSGALPPEQMNAAIKEIQGLNMDEIRAEIAKQEAENKA